jgi:uncharacterized protein (DUF1800 family)
VQGDAPAIRVPAAATPAATADAIRAFRLSGSASQQERRQARRRLVEIVAAEGQAALAERVTTERPFVERLVAFWSNHLCVSVSAKVLVAPLAGSYEREAIRPHVLGRFEDMMLASAKHPAMLVYLDNFQSIGPNSPGARRARARPSRGLNENYARELVELHTLGVDTAATRSRTCRTGQVLTGWTVGGLLCGGGAQGIRGRGRGPAATSQLDPDRPLDFAFLEVLHEPGSKTVLGTRYEAAEVAEGERIIRALCRHPATARFVATKLVAHFVADDPPKQAVERIARAFRDSDGDLRVVAGARSIYRTPGTIARSSVRLRTGWSRPSRVQYHRDIPGDHPLLRQLRHPLWSPSAPKGFGDTTQEWADPDSLLNRAEAARTLARRLRGRLEDARLLLDVIDVPASDPLRGLLSDSAISTDERIALALAGPAFQWR